MSRQSDRYSRKEVLDAIRGSGGIVSRVADLLGCDWHTARAYIDKWGSTKQAMEAEGERVTDVAENKLINSVNDGEQWAVKFWLTTKGKKRGFNERVEVAGEDGGPIPIVIKSSGGEKLNV